MDIVTQRRIHGLNPRALAACIAATLPALAIAQEQPVQRANNLQLEEVIVTVQRRVESLQDTPISVMAFNAEDIEKRGITNIADLQSSVPNMQIAPFVTNASTLNLFVRGIGVLDSQVTVDSPVAVYLDGVYLARNTGLALEIADLQRIEVLRGPQGTLYGRNAVGGALIMETRRPSTEGLEFKQKFTVGDRDLSSFSMLNLPVTDNLAVKLTGLFKEQDGFIDNPTGKKNWGDIGSEGGRFDLSWRITDSLSLDYGYDVSHLDFYNGTYQSITPPPPSSPLDPFFIQAVEDGPGYTNKRLDKLTSVDPNQKSSSNITGHTAVLSWEADSTELKYIFGHREMDNSSYVDLGGGAQFSLATIGYTAPDGEEFPLGYFAVDQEQTSHELQFNADLFDDKLRLLAGAIYFEEDVSESESPWRHQFHGTLIAPGSPADGAIIATYINRKSESSTKGLASYLRAEYTPDILDQRLHLTVGARYSEDERKADAFRYARTAVYIGPNLASNTIIGWDGNGKRNDHNTSYEGIVGFDLNDEINLYAKYSEAYVAGGFNVRDPDPDSNNQYGVGFADGFDPEEVATWEFGMKSELFGSRARLNMDVFFTDYTDRVTSFVVPGAAIGDTKYINAGKVALDGFELDAIFLATQDLRFTLNYSYLDGKMEEVRDPLTGADVTDHYQLPSAPENSYNVAVDWTLASGNWGSLDLYANYSYMDDRNGVADVEEPPNDSSWPSYDLVNARLSWKDIRVFNGDAMVSLWVKNALDEEYVVNATSEYPHSARSVMWGQARSFGVDFSYTY